QVFIVFAGSLHNLTVFIIVTLVIILLGSIFVALKFNPDQYPKTRVSVFFSALASVAIFLVAINIVLTSLSFEYNAAYTRLHQTKASIDKLWLYPNQIITNSHNIRPEFLAGFYPANIKLYNQAHAGDSKTPQSIQGIAEEQYISNLLIQTWEDFLNQRKFDSTEVSTWIKSFLTWAQNPYFKEYYELVKFQYEKPTIEFANVLFEYASGIPVPTRDTTIYQKTAQQMLHDERLKKIFSLSKTAS
uniref:hypothetical protein n=1 Tax=uncultured Legionella sp. TaxID=210934 RepID=UPI002612E20E